MEQQTPGESRIVRRSVIPAQRVRVSKHAAPVGVAHPDGLAEPRVEVVCEGDVVRAIDVICGCGQHIRLLCVYES
jgi:hypothetical protein